MTEPVAYYKDYNDGTTLYFRGSSLTETDKRDPLIKPLYTAEQLHPRVKMTQAEFDELNAISECASVHGAMNQVYSDNNTLMLLKKRFGGSNGQAELARLWFEYRSNNRTQQETIDIVPDMKWFVHKKDCENKFRFLQTIAKHLSYNFPKHSATQFDTKEEAELWTNPLTEAVHLPVEDE